MGDKQPKNKAVVHTCGSQFRVADVTRLLLAVGDMQKRGVTVVIGTPRKLRDSRQRDKATRRQPGTGAFKWCVLDASVGRRKWQEVSGSWKTISELPIVEDTIDTMRKEAEAQMCFSCVAGRGALPKSRRAHWTSEG